MLEPYFMSFVLTRHEVILNHKTKRGQYRLIVDTLMTHVNYHSILQIIILTKRKIDISFNKIQTSVQTQR